MGVGGFYSFQRYKKSSCRSSGDNLLSDGNLYKLAAVQITLSHLGTEENGSPPSGGSDVINAPEVRKKSIENSSLNPLFRVKSVIRNITSSRSNLKDCHWRLQVVSIQTLSDLFAVADMAEISKRVGVKCYRILVVCLGK